jgi:hypothetical protein
MKELNGTLDRIDGLLFRCDNAGSKLGTDFTFPVAVDGLPLQVVVNGVKVSFPETIEKLRKASGKVVDAFLVLYKLSTEGKVAERKSRLGRFIGLRIDVVT